MRDCRKFERMIERGFRDEEIPAGENELLLEHLDECPKCEELFDLLSRMGEDDVYPEPREADLAAVRASVIERLGGELVREERRAAREPWFRSPMFAAGLAGAMLIIGVVTGRALSPAWQVPDRNGAVFPTDDLATQIQRVAADHRDLQDVENSPYTYSNVLLREVDGERVHLSFDVSRHLEVELHRDDPLLRAVLIQSLLQPEAVGTRLKAVGWAGSPNEEKVRDALIRSMLSDENLGVRIAAQMRLSSVERDARIAEAMFAVLSADPSVQMRLAAIDYLAESGADPKRVGHLLASSPDQEKDALYVRASERFGAALESEPRGEF